MAPATEWMRDVAGTNSPVAKTCRMKRFKAPEREAEKVFSFILTGTANAAES